MPLTVHVELPEGDRAKLFSLTRSPSPGGAGLVVLPAADGVGAVDIVRRVGQAGGDRLEATLLPSEGIASLDDRPKTGHPPRRPDAIVLATIEPPPSELGVTSSETTQDFDRRTHGAMNRTDI